VYSYDRRVGFFPPPRDVREWWRKLPRRLQRTVVRELRLSSHDMDDWDEVDWETLTDYYTRTEVGTRGRQR